MKIEPMSVEEIKRVMQFSIFNNEIYWPARLIMAWAHERAEVNRIEHSRDASLREMDRYARPHRGCVDCDKPESDWLNEVLDEIGWPEKGASRED